MPVQANHNLMNQKFQTYKQELDLVVKVFDLKLNTLKTSNVMVSQPLV